MGLATQVHKVLTKVLARFGGVTLYTHRSQSNEQTTASGGEREG